MFNRFYLPSLCMILLSLLVFTIGSLFESFYQVVLFAPLYEELLKFSLFYCFIILYLDDSKVSASRVFIVFILLLLVFSIGDLFNPMNTGNALFLVSKSFISHFGFTVLGGVILVCFHDKVSYRGFIVAFSILISVLLHSIANYMFYVDAMQDLYCFSLGLVGLILLMVFIRR